jgi:hypothetical protein
MDSVTKLLYCTILSGYFSSLSRVITDRIFRRFLSARLFDVQGALKQFTEAQAIRSSVNTAAAYNSIEIDDFEHLRSIVCAYCSGLDVLLLELTSPVTSTPIGPVTELNEAFPYAYST